MNRRGEAPSNKPLEDDDGTLPIVIKSMECFSDGGLDLRWVVTIGNPLVPLFQRLGNTSGPTYR